MYRLTIRFDKHLFELLQAHAHQLHLPLAETSRFLIRDALSRNVIPLHLKTIKKREQLAFKSLTETLLIVRDLIHRVDSDALHKLKARAEELLQQYYCLPEDNLE